MPLTVPVLEGWNWPWPESTLHTAYLLSGLLIALNYVPQLQRAWRFPNATLAAQSMSSWTVWTACRAVAFLYGLFMLHDLLFLVVVGADMLGRLAMVALILRAHRMTSGALLTAHSPAALTVPRRTLYAVLSYLPCCKETK